MADIAAGMAALTVRQDVNVTTSATIDYMAAAPGTGKLIARGRAAARSWRVYSCCGFSKISFIAPCSTILPPFMTITRLQSLRTRLKSWEINKMAVPFF